MNRQHFTFACEGVQLGATLDAADGTTGLLIVSGGNELRCGPFGGHAMLADRVAAAGFPVLRFDRRGVGDSAGTNAGFADSGPDIAAALMAFQHRCRRLTRIVAYGNCDAASALMLNAGRGCDALVLANPWTFEPEAAAEPAPDGAPPPPEPEPRMTAASLRAHYIKRVFDPAAWKRLVSGKVEMGKLAGSLAAAAKPVAPASTLAQHMAAGLAAFDGPAILLIAGHDRTAQEFLAHWDRADPRLRTCPKADHSFSDGPSRIWLQGQLLGALRGA